MAGKRNRQRQARRRAEALAADDVERGEEAAILARNCPAELAAAGVAPDDADGVLAWWGEQRSEAHPCTGEPAQRSIDLLRDFLLAAGPVLEVPAMSEASRLAQMPLATSYQAAQSWLCWIGKQQAAGADYPVDVVDALMWDGLEALGSPDRLLAGVTEESAERAMTLAFETDFQGAPLYCDLVHTTLGGGAAFASAGPRASPSTSVSSSISARSKDARLSAAGTARQPKRTSERRAWLGSPAGMSTKPTGSSETRREPSCGSASQALARVQWAATASCRC